MPLKQDPQGGGKNANGSISDEYCSFCYHKGKFTQPDITVKEMQQFLKSKLKDLGYPWFVASIFAMRVKKLKRWKK